MGAEQDAEDKKVLEFCLMLNPGLTFGDVEITVTDRARWQYRRARDFFTRGNTP